MPCQCNYTYNSMKKDAHERPFNVMYDIILLPRHRIP